MKNKKQQMIQLVVALIVAVLSALIGIVVYYDMLTTNLQKILPMTTWNIFSVEEPKGLEGMANEILRSTALLIGGLLVVFLVLIFFHFFNQKIFTKNLAELAYMDEVTGHSNFRKFMLDAKRLICKNTDCRYALIKLDIENFKLINEIYGAETGDKMLWTLGDVLAQALDSEKDTFGRIHADEFLLLISYHTETEQMEKQHRFEFEFLKRSSELIDFKLVLWRGRYCLQPSEKDIGIIYEKVNFAHKAVKRGNSKSMDFDADLKAQAILELEMVSKMESALKTGEFCLFLQPKYRLRNEKLVGAEALVRWMEEGKPLAAPNDFIPLFEQNGFVMKLDLYMFEKVCQVLKDWIEGGIQPIVISVNFSRLHLSNIAFVEELCKIAGRYNVPCNLLQITFAEAAILHNRESLKCTLSQLHRAGFTFSMDDFGTGPSSLGLLENIPLDVIKIDKTFFADISSLERAKTVIAGMVALARQLGIQATATGVETKEQAELLRALGCETAQGYYYAKPMRPQELEIKLLRAAFTIK